jgi:hypothetical protein
MKMRPVGTELFRADGQTDMRKLMVAFRNFANAPDSHTLSKIPRFRCTVLSAVHTVENQRVDEPFHVSSIILAVWLKDILVQFIINGLTISPL